MLARTGTHFFVTLFLLCIQSWLIESGSTKPPKQLSITQITRVDWGHINYVGSIYVADKQAAEDACGEDGSTDKPADCDMIQTGMYVRISATNDERQLAFDNYISTLSINMSLDSSVPPVAKWNNLTCQIQEPGKIPAHDDCIDISNTDYYTDSTTTLHMSANDSSYAALLMHMKKRGVIDDNGSTVYVKTLNYSGHLAPLVNFDPLLLYNTTPGRYENGDISYFRMKYTAKEDLYIVSAFQHWGKDPNLNHFYPMLSTYSTQGEYQGIRHQLGLLTQEKVHRGAVEPIVDPVSGRICMVILVRSQEELERIAASYGISNVLVPNWMSWDEFSSMVLVFSPDTNALLHAIAIPPGFQMSRCEFYTDTDKVDEHEQGRYIVCSGKQSIRTDLRDYEIAHLMVVDTKRQTVQIQPVPGPTTNPVPSSAFQMHVLGRSPCRAATQATGQARRSAGSIQVLLYGAEGAIYNRMGSQTYGSRGVLQHVDVTHLFAMDSSDTDNKEKRGKPTDQTTLVVPNITYWEALLPDRILSRTIVAADDPTLHVNAVRDLKPIGPKRLNLFLLSTLVHGPLTYTSWDNSSCYHQMQFVDICVGEEDEDSGFTRWLLVIVSGTIVCLGILLGLLRWSKNRTRDPSAVGDSGDSSQQPFLNPTA